MAEKKPARKTAAKKVAPRKPRAAKEPVAPLIEAASIPPSRPRKQTPAAKRRGATAPPGPAELVEQRQRERLAVELAAAGVNDWDTIAQQCGYADRSAAWRAVQRVLNRQEFAKVADYRALIGYRYERIIRANWEAAIVADESTAKEKATPRVLKAMEGLRRTFGLDLELDKIAEAFRIPEDPAERERELAEALQGFRADLRLVVGGDVEST